MKRWNLALVAAAWIVAGTLPVLAQTDRAGVTGSVSDPQGKAVAGAKVTVKNVDTGYTFETTSGTDGHYITPVIFRPGRYTVQAEKQGFKTAVSQPITLQIGDIKEVDLKLELGEVTQTVTVSGTATPLLDTETTERGEVITGRQVTDLPLKDRNFTTLATLTPGVTRAYVGILTDATAFNQGDARFGLGDNVPGGSNNQGSSEASRFSRSGGASLSVNGLRPTNNNFSLDGVDNNEPQFGTIGVFPNPDAIQEFKVETSTPKAEVGRGGAVINTTFQSGTNALHGSAFYYGQNDALNATDWVINRFRQDEVAAGKTPAQAQQDVPKSRIRVNEFGFTLGGPIIKNRTFFFGDFLGQRNATPNPFSTAVPTAKSRMGDFSEFTGDITDPLSCNTPGNISSGGCRNFRQETGGQNVIPNLQSRSDFSPQAFKLLALYPLPTVNVTNPSQGNKNFFGVRQNQERINAYDVKIDHRLTTNNSLMGRFSFSNQQRVRANFFPKVPTAGFGAGDEVGNTRQLVVSDVHTFRPTLLNELNFGWTQVEIGIKNCGVEGACGISPTACQDLGIPNCNHGTPASSGGILSGGFGTGEFEFTGDGGLFTVKSNNFYIADAVTIISGNHTWKAGIQVRPRYLETIDGGRSGGLKGQIQYAQPFSSTTTGNVQADYLLSRPAMSATSGVVVGLNGVKEDSPFHLRTAEWSIFVQDDWKAAPDLMLNLGVRYDIFPNWREANARMANWDPTTRAMLIARGSSDRIVNTNFHNVGPRIGFAYNFGPEKRLVARGGYGIFYTQDGYDYPPVIRNPPLTSSVGLGVFSGNPQVFNLTTGPPAPPVANPPVITPGTTLFTQELNQKVGMIQEFNLGVQWEFARDWLIDVGYVGSRSRHLLATRELGNNNNGLGFARTPAGAVSATNPNPDTPIGFDQAYENRSSANYDALQALLNKRFSHGFLYTAAYTWSHNIDDSTGVFGGIGDARGSEGGPENPFCFRCERANSSLDRRQVFTSNLVWDLPFGRGKWLGSNAGTALDKFIGGWQANVIWTAETGQPFGVESNAPQGGRARPDLIPGCDPRANLPPNRFLNITCFRDPTQSVTNLAGKSVFFGNSGRNRFTGPGFFFTNLSIFKNTTMVVRDREYRVQFGVEFFNAFNQVAHIVPFSFIDDASCTTTPVNPATCASGRFDNAFPPRQIQYRMKIFF